MNNKTTNIMRELKDYFCTYEQENELIRIRYTAKFVSLFEGLEQTENFTSGILRSQALDYFRDKKMLGEVTAIDDWNSYTYGIWMEDCVSPFFKVPTGRNEYPTYHEAESALIDKLIELEKEARNE